VAAPPRRHPPRRLVLLGGAVGAALVVAALVLVLALRPHTSSATVAAQPVPAVSPTAPAAATPSEPTPEPAPASSAAARFPYASARRALDATAPDVRRCRKGKVWGIASATVTFANDGSVAKVAVGVPLTGTPTAACVVDALSTVHVAPFGGKPVVLQHRIYVAPK
jgi:hypothetical protein